MESLPDPRGQIAVVGAGRTRRILPPVLRRERRPHGGVTALIFIERLLGKIWSVRRPVLAAMQLIQEQGLSGQRGIVSVQQSPGPLQV